MTTFAMPNVNSAVSTKLTASLVVAVALTGLSYLVGLGLGWITEVNYLELFAVFTSFSCTYLCVLESRWNYPVGIVSTAALALLFYQSSLLGSMAQNLYLIPTLMYGWYIWGNDQNTKPVEHVKLKTLPIYALVSAAIYAAILYTITKLGGEMAALDSVILVGSILAQFLLDRKKIETWIVWAVVNVIAIYTYYNAGLYFVTFQFIFFLANTIYGWYMWNRSMKGQSNV